MQIDITLQYNTGRFPFSLRNDDCSSSLFADFGNRPVHYIRNRGIFCHSFAFHIDDEIRENGTLQLRHIEIGILDWNDIPGHGLCTYFI